MNEVKIEKNVPMPAPYSRSGLTGTLREMEIGDSIVIPRIRQTNVSTAANTLRRKYSTRKIDDQTIRVWRVA